MGRLPVPQRLAHSELSSLAGALRPSLSFPVPSLVIYLVWHLGCQLQSLFLHEIISSRAGVSKLSVRGYMAPILGFMGHDSSVTTTQLCHSFQLIITKSQFLFSGILLVAPVTWLMCICAFTFVSLIRSTKDQFHQFFSKEPGLEFQLNVADWPHVSFPITPKNTQKEYETNIQGQ